MSKRLEDILPEINKWPLLAIIFKKLSTSLIIREIWVKTTLRYLCTHTRVLLVGLLNGAVTLENNLAVSWKIRIIIQRRIH